MAIIKDFRTGEIYTPKELKARVIKLLGLTGTEAEKTAAYNKIYDRTRNRIRNYEYAAGVTERANVSEFLFREAASKKAYGDKYKPSPYAAAINAATSAGTAKFRSDLTAGKPSAENVAKRVTAIRLGAAFTPSGQLDNTRARGLWAVSPALTDAYNDSTAAGFAAYAKQYGRNLNAQRAAAKKERETSGIPFSRAVVYE